LVQALEDEDEGVQKVAIKALNRIRQAYLPVNVSVL
jgi:HEAT repeat protein